MMNTGIGRLKMRNIYIGCNNQEINIALGELADEYGYLINALREQTQTRAITEHLGVSRQRVHQMLGGLYKKVLQIEQRIQREIEDFDTFLPLDRIEPFWRNLVGNIFALQNKLVSKEQGETEDSFYLVDKRLKPKSPETIMTDILKDANSAPVEIRQIAKSYGFNEDKLLVALRLLYKDQLYLIEGWILSKDKRALNSAFRNYTVAFSGRSVEKMFNDFVRCHPEDMKEKEIASISDVMSIIARYSFVREQFVLIGAGRYETKGYYECALSNEQKNLLTKAAIELCKNIPCATDTNFLKEELSKNEEIAPVVSNLSDALLKEILLECSFFKSGKRFVLFIASRYEECKNKASLHYIISNILQNHGEKTIKEIVELLRGFGRATDKQTVFSAIQKIDNVEHKGKGRYGLK
jgi:hypothetical protein